MTPLRRKAFKLLVLILALIVVSYISHDIVTNPIDWR